MSLARLTRCAILAVALGIACDFALAAWLGWRRAGVVNGATFVVPAGNSTFNFHWEREFGRQSVECNRYGPSLSIAMVRSHYAATYPYSQEASGPFTALGRADVMIPSWSAEALSGPPDVLTGVQAVGFPLRSYSRTHAAMAPSPPRIIEGTLFQSGTDPRRAVAWIPIARGVAINSILWTLLWMPVIAGVPVWRRRLRRRRGRCTNCNYDLRGELSGGCPECGRNRPSAGATPADNLPLSQKLA